MVLFKEAKALNDTALLEDCRQGDATAFDEIVRRYKDRLYHVLYRFLGNHEDALDVAQEAFVRAYHGVDGFKGEAKVFTWLYSIAANLARNRIRDRHRKGRDQGLSLDALEKDIPGRAQTVAVDAKTPRTVAQERELDSVLQRCLNELPEHYRTVFLLRTYENLSYEEIAQAVGCPPGTVKSRLNQARRLLQERLEALSVL